MHKFLVFSYISVVFYFGLSKSAIQQEPCVTPKNDAGKCVDIRNCPSINKLLETGVRPLPTSTVDFLKRSQCGFEGRTPYVCCPKTDFITKKPSKGGRPVDVSNHPSVRLLPDHCGIFTEDKITNGNETTLYEFPWMALLGYGSDYSEIRYRCGGSLVNSKYILTAAHCVTQLSNLELVSVRLGEYDQGTDSDCNRDWGCAPPVQDFGIEKVIPHPQYEKDELIHDIALIRIKGHARYNNAVRPICLPVGKEQWRTLEGESVIVSGWGTTEYGINSQVLLKVDLPVVSNKECANTYRTIAKITEKQICAGGSDGKDSCSGDSGGPLQFAGQTYVGGIGFIQYGIVSFGPRHCGTTGRPGVYTRVGHYMEWIMNNIRE